MQQVKSQLPEVGILDHLNRPHWPTTTRTRSSSSCRRRCLPVLFDLPVPFFASASSDKVQEGRASITTRLPIGKIFDSSRDYIFNTASNVRGYEWTWKETEELLDDLMDGSKGVFSATTNNKDYELSQIVLIPMEWDRELLGLGARYDVYDGQQRLVTLCLLFAAMRERFREIGEEETATELADMLKPPKTRKEEILRMELNPRDNEMLSYILSGADKYMERVVVNDKSETMHKMSKVNQQIVQNFQDISARIGELDKDELLTLLDFIIENVYLLVCVPENAAIARNIVMGQGKGKDNEPIDDFKGLVCFRYTQNEKAVYETLDAWDALASSTVVDVDSGVVGREIVSDACLMRATTALRTKIGTRKQLFWLEQWLRESLSTMETKDQDHFFKHHVQPASLTLGQFREEGDTVTFGFSKGGKITKVWPSIKCRLDFLREMIQNVPATKEVEMIVLETLLRAGGDLNGSNRISVGELEKYLHGAEQLVLYFALIRPNVALKYKKCFELLDMIESGKTADSLDLLEESEQTEIREALTFNRIGANASGKRLARALLKRLNGAVLIKNEEDMIDGSVFLEPILPVKATKKAWGDVWPEKADREEVVHRFGNLCLVSRQVSTRDAKQPFSEKKDRYKSERWPLTSRLGEVESWDNTSLNENAEIMLGLIESSWGLQVTSEKQ
eukprot:scaffold4590_cov112-Cylindrotheca_fusiformis.AAC.1